LIWLCCRHRDTNDKNVALWHILSPKLETTVKKEAVLSFIRICAHFSTEICKAIVNLERKGDEKKLVKEMAYLTGL